MGGTVSSVPSSSVEDVVVTVSSVPVEFAEVGLNVDDLIADVVGNQHMLNCSICDELLTDPVQLKCLHNCCRQCSERSVSSQSSPSIKCKICQEVCDTVCNAASNSFIEGLMQLHRAACRPPVCSFCEEEGVVDQQADVWCSQCEKHLCDSCLPGHRKYNKDHVPMRLGEMDPVPARQQEACSLAGRSAAAAALRLCRLHKKPFEHMCVHCKLPKCFDCALTCSGSEHELHFLKSPRTDAFLADARLDARKLKELLQSKMVVLRSCQKMSENLLADRTANMNTLKENKRAALEALDRAYQAAENALQDCYDSLLADADELATFAECLQAKAVHAIGYCEQLDRLGDVASFVQQEAAVRSRLQSLAAAVRDVNEPGNETSASVSIDAARSIHLDVESVARMWIGYPTIVTERSRRTREVALPSSVNPVAKCGHDFKQQDIVEHSKKCAGTQTADIECISTSVVCASSQTTRCLLSERNGNVGVMRTVGQFRSIVETNRCYDLAVTYRNTVVVAQGDEGLFEYDFVCSHTICTWSPSPRDSVTAVDAVNESRIVVGLRQAEVLAVLQYDARYQMWSENGRLEMHAAPFTLSVYGDIVAVSEWMHTQFGCYSPSPGPYLNLWSLSSRSLILRKPLHFSIFSLAVTESTVAIVSWDGGDPYRDHSSQPCRVAGYDHDGLRRWQRQFNDRVYGICASPSTSALYLAFRNGNRVFAIGEASGRNLLSVCYGDCGIIMPWRLSVSKGHGPAMLAVLESDFKCITVYPIVGHTMLPPSC